MKNSSVWKRTTVYFSANISGTDRTSEFTIDPLLDLSLPTNALRYDILAACREELRHYPAYAAITAYPSLIVVESRGRFLDIRFRDDIQAQLMGRLSGVAA